MKKSWIIAGMGMLGCLCLLWGARESEDCLTRKRLWLFSESIRKGMPENEARLLRTAYTTWLDPSLPADEKIYNAGGSARTTTEKRKEEMWLLAQTGVKWETFLGNYREELFLEVKMENGAVTEKRYWKKRCVSTPDWIGKYHWDCF